MFAVVAQTRGEARRAAKLAKVEAAVGTHCVSVDDALAADSHILPDYTFRKDDSAAALAASAQRVKGRLRIGGQEHFYLEGQVSLAIPGEDGDMLVHSSTQHPSEMPAPDRAACSTCRTRRSPSRCAAWAARSAARRRRPRNGPRSRRSARASPAGRARSGSIATTTCA